MVFVMERKGAFCEIGTVFLISCGRNSGFKFDHMFQKEAFLLSCTKTYKGDCNNTINYLKCLNS